MPVAVILIGVAVALVLLFTVARALFGSACAAASGSALPGPQALASASYSGSCSRR
jgi:hypothetical protein